MSFIRSERRGDVVEVTLARPPLNILHSAMLAELRLAVEAAEPARLLVLRGEGKAFSAGADVGEHLPERARAMLEAFHGAIRAIAGARAVTVACLQGAALGGGAEVALACDLVLAARDAQIGQPEIKLGVFPPVAMTLLPRLCPPRKAFELIMTGEPVSADEAQRLGLVSQVFEAADFAAGVERYLAKLEALSPSSLRATKAALRRLHPGDLAALPVAEAEYHDRLMRTEDAVEGLRSFLEKRRPQWKPLAAASEAKG